SAQRARTSEEQAERGPDLAVVVGDREAGGTVRLNPEARSQLLVAAVERHEREVVVVDAEPRSDAALRVLDLDLAGPDDALPHRPPTSSWSRRQVPSVGRSTSGCA